jgi:predicted Fe-Mo cluster-binding NifX family protein
MKSNMIINVEFLAGTRLEEAIEEAINKARIFDVAYICFNWNGVDFSIGRNADIQDALKMFESGNTKYGICSA